MQTVLKVVPNRLLITVTIYKQNFNGKSLKANFKVGLDNTITLYGYFDEKKLIQNISAQQNPRWSKLAKIKIGAE